MHIRDIYDIITPVYTSMVIKRDIESDLITSTTGYTRI